MARVIPGLWRGVFEYDAVEGEPSRDPGDFELSLKRGHLWRFRGTTMDLLQGALARPASIAGFAFGSRVLFWKQYAQPWVFANEETVSLHAWLERNGVEASLSRQQACRIRYIGAVDRTGSRMQGRWTIKAHTVGYSVEGIWQTAGATGIWNAERVAAR